MTTITWTEIDTFDVKPETEIDTLHVKPHIDIFWTEIDTLDVKPQTDILMSSAESDARSGWKKIEDRLLTLRRLEDDWDGLGAYAPEREVVDSALVFLKKYRADGSLPPRRVVAGPNGEILFEWQLQGAVIEAEIEEPGIANWAAKESGEPAECWEEDFAKKYQDELWGASETLAPNLIAA